MDPSKIYVFPSLVHYGSLGLVHLLLFPPWISTAYRFCDDLTQRGGVHGSEKGAELIRTGAEESAEPVRQEELITSYVPSTRDTRWEDAGPVPGKPVQRGNPPHRARSCEEGSPRQVPSSRWEGHWRGEQWPL